MSNSVLPPIQLWLADGTAAETQKQDATRALLDEAIPVVHHPRAKSWGRQMQFVLDLPAGSNQPIYKQVCEALIKAIKEGRLKPGEKLPSSRELAVCIRVSRFTVIRSYELLTAQGFIQTTAGSGTFVSDRIPEGAIELEPISEWSDELPLRSTSLELSDFGRKLMVASAAIPQDVELFSELNYGAPSIDQLPLRAWREVLNKCARFQDESLFQYISDPMGYAHLREAISAYLTRARSVKSNSQRVAVFSGAQSALDVICRMLLNPGDTVAVEDPGSPSTRRTLLAHEANILGIPVDKEGIVVHALYQAQERIKLVYVTPSHQDPTGSVMSMARRQELLKWAAETSAFIVEDDFDSEYHYGDKPVSSLQGLDQSDCVIYLSSLWKVLYPVVRMAFLVLPRKLVQPVGTAKALIERDSPMLEQVALTEFLNDGILERQIRRTKAVYAKRRAALMLALARQLKDSLTISGAGAGMHLIVRFNDTLDAEHIKACARQAGLPMVGTEQHYAATASVCAFVATPATNEFMMSFAHHPEEILTARVDAFANLLSS
jgi:GntR family transcriptional regulator/MocR family aminotransferase